MCRTSKKDRLPLEVSVHEEFLGHKQRVRLLCICKTLKNACSLNHLFYKIKF